MMRPKCDAPVMADAATRTSGAANQTACNGGLARRLGIGTSTALVIGFIIGSGIFRVPSRVAANVYAGELEVRPPGAPTA
jgi:hypothetical protein